MYFMTKKMMALACVIYAFSLFSMEKQIENNGLKIRFDGKSEADQILELEDKGVSIADILKKNKINIYIAGAVVQQAASGEAIALVRNDQITVQERRVIKKIIFVVSELSDGERHLGDVRLKIENKGYTTDLALSDEDMMAKIQNQKNLKADKSQNLDTVLIPTEIHSGGRAESWWVIDRGFRILIAVRYENQYFDNSGIKMAVLQRRRDLDHVRTINADSIVDAIINEIESYNT